jgi:hypothetical protein
MMTTWLAGGDAEMIDTLPANVLATFAVLFPYGPNLGAHGGPGRQTPQAWTAAQPQPKWVVFFPGANPAQALAYARAVGAVGVVVDIEPGVEQDAWTLSVSASFGDYMIANGMPVAVYSHKATCAKLAAHFTAQWWDGQAKPVSLPARVAVQYGQQTASNGVIFDLDACDSYFVDPNPQPDPPPPTATEDTDMGYISAISAVLPNANQDKVVATWSVDGAGVVWHRWSLNDGTWADETLPPCSVAAVPGTISVLIDTNYNLWHVWAYGKDGTLLHWYQPLIGGNWVPQPLPGASAPVSTVGPKGDPGTNGTNGLPGAPGVTPTSGTILGPIAVTLA